MIRYALACEHGHEFEGWFGSSGAYDEQVAAGQVECPVCATRAISKQIMAPAVAGTKKTPASDLPPQVADQNIDYFRALVNQPAYWQEFAADDIETPAFDDQPAPKKAAAKKQEPAPMLKEAATPATPAAATTEPAPAAKSATPATPASATPAEAPVPLLKGSE